MARKTFASTVLLYNDVPMEIVSEHLGQSSIKITQEYYGKIVQKMVSEEMEGVPKFKNNLTICISIYLLIIFGKHFVFIERHVWRKISSTFLFHSLRH